MRSARSWAIARAGCALLEARGRELDTRELRRIYDDIERPLVPVLAAMERHGIRVEPARLEEFAKELERDLDNLTREIYALAGRELHDLLAQAARPDPVREAEAAAAAAHQDRLLDRRRRARPSWPSGHPLPGKVLEHRTLSKLKGTYADALPLLVNPATGRIHTTFNQLVAATGRLRQPGPEPA